MNDPMTITRLLSAFALLFFLPMLLCAQTITVKEYSCAFDLPGGWVVTESKEENFPEEVLFSFEATDKTTQRIVFTILRAETDFSFDDPATVDRITLLIRHMKPNGVLLQSHELGKLGGETALITHSIIPEGEEKGTAVGIQTVASGYLYQFLILSPQDAIKLLDFPTTTSLLESFRFLDTVVRHSPPALPADEKRELLGGLIELTLPGGWKVADDKSTQATLHDQNLTRYISLSVNAEVFPYDRVTDPEHVAMWREIMINEGFGNVRDSTAQIGGRTALLVDGVDPVRGALMRNIFIVDDAGRVYSLFVSTRHGHTPGDPEGIAGVIESIRFLATQ